MIFANILNNNQKFDNQMFITIGDSISWQDKNDYPYVNGKKAIGYQSIIKSNLNFKSYINLSESGKSIANNTPNGYGLNTLVNNFPSFKEYNIIIISGGTNDFKLNVPLGNLANANFDTSTFTGAYQNLIEKILKTSTKEKILLLTPLERDNDGFNSWSTKNNQGLMLMDYRNRILEIGKYYGIPVLDLYTISGFNKVTLKKYTYDGLHPNDRGYKLIGNILTQYIILNYGGQESE